MKIGYEIIEGKSRTQLKKRVDAMIADAPHEWEIGNFAVVPVEGGLYFYQLLVRKTYDKEAFGLTEAMADL